MQTIQLKAMTRELCRELYRHWTNDASIYMDMRLFRPYVYDEVAVNRYFDAKGQDASRRLFAIMLGDTVVGELQLKQIDHDKKECTLSIHMQNDAVKGKGYGTQAERLAVKIAFDELGMAAVNADTVMKNTRSQHVLALSAQAPYPSLPRRARKLIHSAAPPLKIAIALLDCDFAFFCARRRNVGFCTATAHTLAVCPESRTQRRHASHGEGLTYTPAFISIIFHFLLAADCKPAGKIYARSRPNTGKSVLNGHRSVPARAYTGGHGYRKQRKNSSACASQADERSGATYAAHCFLSLI